MKKSLIVTLLVLLLAGCATGSNIYNPSGVPIEELASVEQEFIYSEHVFIRGANGVMAEGLSNPMKSNRLERFSPGKHTFYWTLIDSNTFIRDGYMNAHLKPGGKYFIGFKKEGRKIIGKDVEIWDQITGEVVSSLLQ